MEKSKLLYLICFLTWGCLQASHNVENIETSGIPFVDSLAIEEKEPILSWSDIIIEKELLYNQYTLEDTYPYKDTVRKFQWEKIKGELARIENAQHKSAGFAILQNRQNKNGEAPLVKNYKRNTYTRITDTLGTERFQSIPLYLMADTITPELYSRDGSLVKVIATEGGFVHLETIYEKGEWMVPKRYVKQIDAGSFERVAVVDRANQNIATVEKEGNRWLVRSMNPATTGLHRPPYQQETPLGFFVVQEKKEKMYYLVDGTSEIGGFSPYATRFCNGGYIHGIPVNLPRTTMIEYSNTLGTIPRSHMCVRNASSHAKFVYDWAEKEKSLVIVIE